MNFVLLLPCLVLGLTLSNAVSKLVIVYFTIKLEIFKPFEKDTKDKEVTRSSRDATLLFLLTRVELLSAVTTSLLLLFVFQSFFTEETSLDIGYFLVFPTVFTIVCIFLILFISVHSKQFFKYLIQFRL